MGPHRGGKDREDDLGGREGDHQQITLNLFNTNKLTNTNTNMKGCPYYENICKNKYVHTRSLGVLRASTSS